jgi:hypothetical protein
VKTGKVWSCKIGFADGRRLPRAADGPMREAIAEAFRELTGHEPDFIFSGWGAELDDAEKRVIEPPQ